MAEETEAGGFKVVKIEGLDERDGVEELTPLQEAFKIGGPLVRLIGGWGDVWYTQTARDVTIRFPFPWDEEETARAEFKAGETFYTVLARVEGGGVRPLRIGGVPEEERGKPPYKWLAYRPQLHGERVPGGDDAIKLPVQLEGRPPSELEVKLRMVPIPSAGGRTLELTELIVWLAINEARDEGDEERARRYYDALYPEKPKAAPMVQNYRGDYVFYSTSLAHVETFKIPAGAGSKDIDVSGKNEKHPVLTSIRWDAAKDLTPFHEAAYDRAMDFYRAGLPYFTVRQLCVTLKGADSDANISAAFEERAAAAIMDMAETRIWIDAYTEIARYSSEVKGAWSAVAVLPVDPLLIQDKRGNLIDGFKFTGEEPPLHAHDMAIGQYTALPTAAFKRISSAVSMTPAAITIRDYLIRRIKRMTTAQTSIRYKTIAEATKNTSMKPADLREKVGRLLDGFKAEGLIEGWSEYADAAGKPVGVRVRIKTEAAKAAPKKPRRKPAKSAKKA